MEDFEVIEFKEGDSVVFKGGFGPRMIIKNIFIKDIFIKDELSCLYVDNNGVIYPIVVTKEIVEHFGSRK